MKQLYIIILLAAGILFAGERSEIISKRTYQSRTFNNGDGTFSTEISNGYMHYKDKDGKYKAIESGFIKNDSLGYSYNVTKGMYHVFAKSDVGQTDAVRFETKDGHYMSLQLWGMGYLDINSKSHELLQKVWRTQAEADGNKLTYYNAFRGIDVKYTYYARKLKEEIVISQQAREQLKNPARLGYALENTYLVFISKIKFNRDELTYLVNNEEVKTTDYETEDRISFRDRNNKLKYFFPVDFAFMQSERDSVFRDNVIKVRKRIIERNGEYFLLSGVPLKWVQELPKGTLVVDPQIAIQPDEEVGKDARIYYYAANSNYANTNFGTSEKLQLLRWTSSMAVTQQRSLLQFDLSAIPGVAEITSAQLELYWHNLGTSGSGGYHGAGTYSRYSISSSKLCRVTQTWDESTVTWNTQPAYTETNAVNINAPSGPSANLNADITDLINEVRENGNYGFMWKLQTESPYRSVNVGSSDHTDLSRRPKLTITYKMYEKHFYLKDHLGNIRVTVDEAGDVVACDDYYPFGLQMPGRSYNQANLNNMYKYSGKELDEESNLDWYYFGARYYEPAIGRWMSVDPLAEKYPDMTSYHYTHNNPFNRIDPDGNSDGYSQLIFQQIMANMNHTWDMMAEEVRSNCIQAPTEIAKKGVENTKIGIRYTTAVAAPILDQTAKGLSYIAPFAIVLGPEAVAAVGGAAFMVKGSATGLKLVNMAVGGNDFTGGDITGDFSSMIASVTVGGLPGTIIGDATDFIVEAGSVKIEKSNNSESFTTANASSTYTTQSSTNVTQSLLQSVAKDLGW